MHFRFRIRSELRKQKTGTQAKASVFQTVFDVIHRSADQLSVGICLAEMYGKCHLEKLGAHAKDCGYPHPENCTRSADCDCACHTCHISGSNCRRECGTDRLKRSQCSIRCLSLFSIRPMVTFIAYGNLRICKTGFGHSKQADTDNADHCGHTPDKVIYYIVDLFYRL